MVRVAPLVTTVLPPAATPAAPSGTPVVPTVKKDKIQSGLAQAAIRAAQLGLSVAVVERQKALGGTCLLWGCIPTKALLEHAHALKIAQSAKEWGITLPPGDVGIDMGQVQSRKDRIITGLTKGIEFLFKKNKTRIQDFMEAQAALDVK